MSSSLEAIAPGLTAACFLGLEVLAGLCASLLGCPMGEENVPRWVKGMGPGRGTRVDLRGKRRQALLLVQVYYV